MNKNKILIGSHVSMNSKHNYLLGSLQETLANNGNAMMIYTGAPQNSKRADLEVLKIAEFKKGLKQHNMHLAHVIVHGPYIINIANTINEATHKFGIDFLIKELKRAEAIGAEVFVLHPGSALGKNRQLALDRLVKGLDIALDASTKIKIALENMAGKGTQIGVNFEELAYVINHSKHKDRVGLCLDTCHMHDAGYDISMNQLDHVLKEINNVIPLSKVFVIHVNDAKLPFHNKKDRHANIGYGYIGFDNIINFLYHPHFKNIVKILETPYLNKISPYKAEIAMILSKKFNNPFPQLAIIKKPKKYV